MRPFDDAWWDERILNRDGKVDLANTDFSSPLGAWVRWRLVDDLMTRFYIDYGLEGIFGINGEDPLYQFRLASPTCARAPRYFGRICAIGPHVAVIEDAPEVDAKRLAPYRVQFPTEGDLKSHTQTWDCYQDYLKAVIADLGLAEAGVVGHEACFHRRGRSAAQLAFRLAVLLRTSNGGEVSPNDHIVSVTPDNEEYVRAAAPWFREPLDKGAPRCLLVTAGATPETDEQLHIDSDPAAWIISNEGKVHHAAGAVDARELWRRGALEPEIVADLVDIDLGD